MLSDIQNMDNKTMYELLKRIEDKQDLIEKRLDVIEQESQQSQQTNLEVYYQRKLEVMFPGAGHRTLKTQSGSTIVTDLTSPDDWSPVDHNGMPSFHMEVKHATERYHLN